MNASAGLWWLVLFVSMPVGAQDLVASPPSQVAANRSQLLAEASIVRFYVDDPASDSKHESGPLHIVYGDGTEVVRELRPAKAARPGEDAWNQEGFFDVHLADDKRTIGWIETYGNCCTSYALPLVLVLYRSGKIILHIHQDQILWSWSFRDGAKRVATVWGATHLPQVGDYQLYDVNSGRMLSQVFSDETAQGLSADAPSWALQLQATMRQANVPSKR